MREVFDEEDLPPVGRKADTEVTLGLMGVSGLIFALLLLCGLCFALGYSMGGHSSKGALTLSQTPATPATNAAAASTSKPGAAPQKISTAQPANSATQNDALGANPAVASPSSGSSTGQPGAAPVTPLMVQIATVSHQDDADVLLGALRKRGYAVTVSQDDADSQFHVRVGPFASLTEASAMRQKLINDGYNAVIQP